MATAPRRARSNSTSKPYKSGKRTPRTGPSELPRADGAYITPTTRKRVETQISSTTGLEKITLTTAHCTIVAVDIEGFGHHSRNNTNQVRIRHGMYRSMQLAFDVAGIRWLSCHNEDRGDGVLVLAPAEIPKAWFVDHLPDALADALAEHNKTHPTNERIRLRLALHAGEINYDDHGVTASSITHTFRLVDAEILKDTFAKSSTILAVISSDWFYDEVIRHSELCRARSYKPLNIKNKETTTQAWIRLVKARTIGRSRQSGSIPNDGHIS